MGNRLKGSPRNILSNRYQRINPTRQVKKKLGLKSTSAARKLVHWEKNPRAVTIYNEARRHPGAI